MTGVYLIGGGWTPRSLRATLSPFLHAAGGATARIACVLLDSWVQRLIFPAYAAAMRAAGAGAVAAVFVSPARPLRASALVGATGILVGGGAAPPTTLPSARPPPSGYPHCARATSPTPATRPGR